MSTVWCILAPEDSGLTGGREALALAAPLAEVARADLAVLSAGEPAAPESELGALGVARLVELAPAPPALRTDWIAARFAEVLAEPAGDAVAVIWPPGAWAREVATRTAVRLGSGLVTDAVRAEWKDGPEGRRLAAERPIYGGKAVATMALSGLPMLQVKAASQAALVAAATPTACVREVRSCGAVDGQGATLLARREAQTSGPRLTEAKRIVAGGRGLGGPEPFALLRDLAELIGGAVGASRAAVDAGWIPPSHQIGQTGVSVAPDLYLAVGISGASQHTAGITRARHVVVINRDAEAPLFQMAELGVVGDFREVVPALMTALRDSAS